MRHKLTLLLVVMPVFAWALLGTLGDRISSHLAFRFGPQIVGKGDGKFTDATAFVAGRLHDAVLLVTVACFLLLAYRLLVALAHRGLSVPARWIVQGWIAFFCLNVFCGAAAHTVLFWCILFNGKNHTHNFTQFRIKQGLLTEVSAPHRAVLLGASQTRTEIDSKAVNERLDGKVWTTELHFPGSSVFDRVLCLKRLPPDRIDYVVTYISEFDFFGAHDNERLVYFFDFQDLPDWWALGQGRPPMDPWMAAGLLGDAFPLYRIWDPLSERVRFWQQENTAQVRHDAALEHDLSERARRVAKNVNKEAPSQFELNRRAFEAFATLCRERHCQLVICCGQVNPILARAMDPSLRPAMMDYLHQQAAKDSNIILIEAPILPPHVEADYEDLTHVNLGARARVSAVIGDVLEDLDRQKSR